MKTTSGVGKSLYEKVSSIFTYMLSPKILEDHPVCIFSTLLIIQKYVHELLNGERNNIHGQISKQYINTKTRNRYSFQYRYILYSYQYCEIGLMNNFGRNCC